MATAMVRTRRRPEHEPQQTSLRLAPSRRRRPRLLIGSVAILLACTALFVSAYERAGRQMGVLAVVKAVPQGGTIEASDIAVARMSASGAIVPIPASELDAVVGRRASVALVRGGILTASDIARSSTIPAGDAVVGIAAKSSQLPSEGIAPGETVDVVLTGVPGSPVLTPGSSAAPSNGTSGAVVGSQPLQLAGAVLAPNALVTGVGSTSAAGTDQTDISLLVPLSVAPLIATASAAGQVALIVVTSDQ